jgi:aminoglycoside phosphotransferase (APT) family kinase protein
MTTTIVFDPNEQPERCERYLSHYLGEPVRFIKAERLKQSSREAPWRLDTQVSGLERSFVLQVDPHGMEYEYQVLKAVEVISVPTPHSYGLELNGEMLGAACFFEDFIQGDTLLQPVLDGEDWAEELFIEATCTLQSITDQDLGDVATMLERHDAADVLEDSYSHLKDRSLPLVEQMYQALHKRMPDRPAIKFSNGDLWLENFVVLNQKLVGVIDFQMASFSDPIFEFLLSFFILPQLHGRGIEERYCQRIGCDPAILNWYHGLEFFETYRYLLLSGTHFFHHSASSLEVDMKRWLEDS